MRSRTYTQFRAPASRSGGDLCVVQVDDGGGLWTEVGLFAQFRHASGAARAAARRFVRTRVIRRMEVLVLWEHGARVEGKSLEAERVAKRKAAEAAQLATVQRAPERPRPSRTFRDPRTGHEFDVVFDGGPLEGFGSW